jgi:hypothetical protein
MLADQQLHRLAFNRGGEFAVLAWNSGVSHVP